VILPPAPVTATYPYVLPFRVRQDDDIHRIVRDMLGACGYPDISSFEADIRLENPTITDWQAVAENSVLNLPSATATPAKR
jgi:hypothetical protein